MENNYSVTKNVPQSLKQIITGGHIYINDSVMACYSVIPSADNILIKITVCSSFYKKIASTYYNDKGDVLDSFWGSTPILILNKLIILI